MHVGFFKQRTYHRPNEVKSVSIADSTASALSQVHDASGLAPHGQLEPVNDWFSLVDRSQVHWPTGGILCQLAPKISIPLFGEGNILHEHLAPETVFSIDALLQEQ